VFLWKAEPMMKRAVSESGKNERLAEILRVARSVFSKNKFEGTTVREIARKAKLSPAAIYLYFKSKDELYGTILVEIYSENNRIFRAAAETGGSVRDRLLGLLKAYLQFMLKAETATGLLEIKINTLKLSPPLRRQLERLSAQYFGIVIDIIEEGQAKGAISAGVEAGVVAYALLAMVDGFSVYEECGDFSVYGYEIEDVLEKGFDYFYRGIFV
jgi:AcrR family transcriptional regulator